MTTTQQTQLQELLAALGLTIPQTPPALGLSISEAAAWAGVCPKTIYRWIDDGKLKAYRLGPRTVRVDRESLLALAQPAGSAS